MSDTAKDQARAQCESIVEMVAALECDYDRLEELREQVNALNDASQHGECADIRAELDELETAAGDCASQDEARERIQEDALSVEVRSGWTSLSETLQPEEFRIVLCTGGPHVEIVGELNRFNEPDSVRILFKDWGTSGELFDFDHDAVLAYCQCFYFGE